MTTAVILAILFCSTLIRSTFGFGDAVVAMPLLVLMVGLKTATPLVALIAGTIAFTILVRHWREIQFKSAWPLMLSSALGIPLGLYFLKGAYETPMKIVLAVSILAFALWNLAGVRSLTLKRDRSSWLFGFAAGVLGGAYNTNGPVVVVYGTLRQWPPRTFRATLQGYFLFTGSFVLLGHAATGLWTRTVALHYLWSLPVVFCAIFMGEWLSRKIARGRFDRWIHWLLLVLGGVLLAQTLLHPGP